MKKRKLIFLFLLFSLLIIFHQLQALETRVQIGQATSIIESVILNEGQDISLELKPYTTSVSAKAIISNNNGYEEIGVVTAVIFRTSKTDECLANNNNCYLISSCVPSNCFELFCEYTCSASFKHYADPTDTYWQDDSWSATVFVQDTEASDSKTSDSVNLITNTALLVTSPSLSYSEIKVGIDTQGLNQVVEIVNIGNSPIIIEVKGTNMQGIESENIILAEQQQYSLSSFIYGQGLILTRNYTELTSISKPTSEETKSINVYWGIGIPTGTVLGIYQGENTFSVSLDLDNWPE